MSMKKECVMVIRNAAQRGTAVQLPESQVRFVWPCGCTQTERLRAVQGVMGPSAVSRLVRNWRKTGVVLDACKRHPHWTSPYSQLERLNREHPDRKNDAALKKEPGNPGSFRPDCDHPNRS